MSISDAVNSTRCDVLDNIYQPKRFNITAISNDKGANHCPWNPCPTITAKISTKNPETIRLSAKFLGVCDCQVTPFDK